MTGPDKPYGKDPLKEAYRVLEAENKRLREALLKIEKAAVERCAEYNRRHETGPAHMRQYNLERAVGAGDTNRHRQGMCHQLRVALLVNLHRDSRERWINT